MRSPAEYYIRYKLVKEADKPLLAIEEELRRELVFSPHKDYLERLRKEMQIPKSFHPENLCDFVSTRFLRKHGIWSMWHPHRGTREAVEIFRNRRARSLLQTLVAGPHPDQVIFEVFIRKAKLPLSDAGLSEFKHYFWNINLLTVQELQTYTSTFLKDPILLDVIDARTTPEHMLLALSQIGVQPQIIDEEKMLESYRMMFYLDAIATQKSMKPSLSRSTALNLAVKGSLEVSEAIRKIRIERGEDVDNIYRYEPQTVDFPSIDLKQLGDGYVPFPVAALNLEEESDKKESTGDAS